MELMRGLAFIALLFAGSAVGAELRQAEVCGDGTTHQAGYCPAVLSSASCSATGATTGSCSATSDEADGTRYVCATSSATALTGAEIEACSGGAAIAGSSAAETGSNSVSLSGLTTDAAHYGQIVNESPEGWYSNRLVSSSFTPPASGLYNLGSIPTEVSTVAFATEPTITSSATVTDLAGLMASIQVDGRHTTVQAGSTINLTGGNTIVFNGASDHWLEVEAGATINSPNSGWYGIEIIASSRIKITGAARQATFNSGIRFAGNSTDILLDGVLLDAPSSESQNDMSDSTRVTILNSYIDGNLFSFYGYSLDQLILANSQIVASAGQRATFRLGSLSNSILVDNLIQQNEETDDHFFRLEADANTVFFGRNQFEGILGTQGFEISTVAPGEECCPYTSTTLIFWDNNYYNPSGNMFFYAPGEGQNYVVDMQMDGDRFYTNSETADTPIVNQEAGWSIVDSLYKAYQAPPAWSF